MSHFKLSFQKLDLELSQPFTIARGTKKVVNNILVKLTDGEFTGYGEAAPNSHYHEDAAGVIQFLKQLPEDFFDNIKSPEALASSLDNQPRRIQSGKVALEMAWLDWWGKSRHQPLWKLWEVPRSTGPVTSYTIGLDEIEIMQQKVRNAHEYPIYKVKLGTNHDREIIEALREVTDKPIRVDANEGWTTLDEAKRMIGFLEARNIELVEQPMPANAHNALRQLKSFSPLPLCADESFMGDESLDEIAESFDIINIKLMKTGSLIKARRIIKQAREYNLKVMIGCMIESSVANTAGALLGLWADYVDLDGHLLIDNDPAAGLQLTVAKKVQMPDRDGLGVKML